MMNRGIVIIRELKWFAACVAFSSLLIAACGVTDFAGPGEAIVWTTILVYPLVQLTRWLLGQNSPKPK
jgi:hypothetical protein